MLNFLKTFFIFLLYFLFTLATPVLAKNFQEPTIDIYRTSQISVEKLKKKLGNQIKKVSNLIASPESLNSKSNIKAFEKLIKEITKEIYSMGDFLYVNVIPVLYPNENVIHFSIDIVDKKDGHRINHFLSRPIYDIDDPDNLVKNWLLYEKEGFSFVWKEKKFPEFKKCPAHHCLFGFDHKKLKKYQNIFNDSVPKYKRELISILQYDKDEEKRAASAFLLAHLKDSTEVIKSVSPSIYDTSRKVRNNVMRVLASIASNEPFKLGKFPIKKIIVALDFPDESDRNKALEILAHLINNPTYLKYVKKHASQKLIYNLKLLQPNLHSPSFKILKKISRESFSEYDYDAWEQWAKAL